jgi:hypothetical protein
MDNLREKLTSPRFGFNTLKQLELKLLHQGHLQDYRH